MLMPVQALAACVTPVVVKVEFAGNLSFVDTSVVLATFGCLVAVSSTASITGVLTLPLHAGAVPVHVGSPPPLAVAVFVLGLAVEAATFTGTVITTGPLVPAAIEQPLKLVAPLAGQPLKVPPVAVIAPLVVMPLGKLSLTVIGAVVGPLATLIVIV
jgi:hypothetical protein